MTDKARNEQHHCYMDGELLMFCTLYPQHVEVHKERYICVCPVDVWSAGAITEALTSGSVGMLNLPSG